MPSAWDVLREFGGSDMFGRLDFTGNRAGLYRPSISRGGQFPYDRDVSYGQPGHGPLDRGNSGRGPGRRPPTPRDVSHTAWADFQEPEDAQQEAMGSPSNSLIAYRTGQQPTDVPGASRGWSGPPVKPWDDLEEAPLNVAPGETARTQEDPSFDEVPSVTVVRSVPGDVKRFGTDRPFGSGLGRALSPSRGRYGLMPKESRAWSFLRVFLSSGT